MNRKTIALLCAAMALLALLAGCGQKADGSIVFTGTVEEIHSQSFLVRTADDVGFDLADAGYGDDVKINFELAVGQTVKVTILPDIAESDPVQVTAVAVELISDPPATPPASAEDGVESVQSQIRLIAENVQLWENSADYANDVFYYAVTDLDGNGRLELIAANCGGTGHYTYSSFYEVSETRDSLALCEKSTAEGESELDIGTAASVPVYFDAETGTRYYIFTDDLKISAGEYYVFVRALSLQGGKVTETPLAAMHTVYEGAEPKVTCEDADQQEITEDAYNAAADTAFAGMEKETASFGWREFAASEQVSDLSAGELLAMLTASYEGFRRMIN